MASLYEVERAQRQRELEGGRLMLKGLATQAKLFIALWIVVAMIGCMAQWNGSAERGDDARPAQHRVHDDDGGR